MDNNYVYRVYETDGKLTLFVMNSASGDTVWAHQSASPRVIAVCIRDLPLFVSVLCQDIQGVLRRKEERYLRYTDRYEKASEWLNRLIHSADSSAISVAACSLVEDPTIM